MALLFYDREEQPWGIHPSDLGGHRVIYSEAPRSSLQRAKPSNGLSGDWTRNLCRVNAVAELSLPESMPEKRQTSSDQARKAYDRLFARMGKKHGKSIHRMGGHPVTLQGPMKNDCEMIFQKLTNPERKRLDNKSSRPDWRLLLQLDSDAEGPDWM